MTDRREWLAAAEAALLLGGLGAIDELAHDRLGLAFTALAEADRGALLVSLDSDPAPPGSPAQAFDRLKALTIYGYFTSERVQQGLRAVAVPGRFGAGIPLPTH